MFALFFKLLSMVHHWPTASSAARESRRWDVITTIKRIIWCKWTPRCSRVPCVTITLHCNLLMWLHYNTAREGVTHRAPVAQATPAATAPGTKSDHSKVNGLEKNKKQKINTEWRCGRYMAWYWVLEQENKRLAGETCFLSEILQG